MIPIRDDIPSSKKPFVTYTLLAMNIVVFIYVWLQPLPIENATYRLFGFTPALFFGEMKRLAYIPSWLTLLSSQFLHGGFSHIIGNMLYLWVFGDNVEDELGHLPFLWFYLGSGAVGALLHGVFNTSSTLPLIGASGAIAGILGAYFVFFPHARVRSLVPIFFFFITVNVPAVVFLGVWFLLQLLNNSMAGSVSTVAYLAHIGGFLVGAIVALWHKRNRRNSWELLPPDDLYNKDNIPLQ